MRLVEAVQRKTGADFSEIMLLRNANWRSSGLHARGGSMEEWISVKRKNTRFDYRADGKPPINVVVVIVRDRERGHDCVFGVRRVLGVDSDGTPNSLASEPLRHSYKDIGREDAPARKFKMEAINSALDGAPIAGWEGREIAGALRSDGNLFWDIEVELPD